MVLDHLDEGVLDDLVRRWVDAREELDVLDLGAVAGALPDFLQKLHGDDGALLGGEEVADCDQGPVEQGLVLDNGLGFVQRDGFVNLLFHHDY